MYVDAFFAIWLLLADAELVQGLRDFNLKEILFHLVRRKLVQGSIECSAGHVPRSGGLCPAGEGKSVAAAGPVRFHRFVWTRSFPAGFRLRSVIACVCCVQVVCLVSRCSTRWPAREPRQHVVEAWRCQGICANISILKCWRITICNGLLCFFSKVCVLAGDECGLFCRFAGVWPGHQPNVQTVVCPRIGSRNAAFWSGVWVFYTK